MDHKIGTAGDMATWSDPPTKNHDRIHSGGVVRPRILTAKVGQDRKWWIKQSRANRTPAHKVYYKDGQP